MENQKEPSRKKKNGHTQVEQQAVEMLGIEADEIRERLSGLDTQLRTMARQKPIAVVCGALLVGYVVGRIVSR